MHVSRTHPRGDATNIICGAAPVDRLQRLRADVVRCAVPRDHLTQPRANQRVRQWLADDLAGMGLEVSICGEMKNVLALPPGARRGAVTLVGAHYDSVPMSPGADDNASAVAVLLEVARSWKALGRSVGFVAFNAEERGLAGSEEFVHEELQCSGLSVRGAHVLEMVGYTSSLPGSQMRPVPLPGMPTVGDFIGLVANQASRRLLAQVLDCARRLPAAPPTVALQTWLGSERLVADLHRSDHAPFWRAGVPAVLWTDTAEFRNPNYHRPSDTPDTLDYPFMAAVCALLETSLGRGVATA